MTHKLIFISILVLVLALSACGTNAPAPVSPSNGADITTEQPAPVVVVDSREQYTSPNLDATYDEALPVRLQLTLGTLMLEGTPEAISPEQAQELLPLWQALQALTNSGTSATAETNAVLAQIESSLTAEQLTAIRAMRLTSPQMQEWASQNGIRLGSGGGAGGGQGGGMSPEARATRQAEEGKTPSETGTSNGASVALDQSVIAYLEDILP